MAEYEKTIEVLKTRLEAAETSANVDHLSGVYNRRMFDRMLSIWLKRYKTTNEPLSLAVFDIDLFKNFNDEYGHDMGDQVIANFAQILRSEVRSQDYAFRYGGEEFTVIFPNTTIQDACYIAERIRAKIAARKLISRETRNITIMITVSCGITQVTSDDTEQSIFSRADKNLYKAKKSGRNRIESDT